MKHCFTLFCLLILFSITPIQAQNHFREGFIINGKNDTITGEVKYRTNTKNYQSCIFKKDGKITEYTSDQLLGFGYDNDKFFTSTLLDSAFVEVLVSGKLSLYKFRSNYLLKKAGYVYAIKQQEIEVLSEGKPLHVKDQNWRRKLAFLISDCLPDPNKTVAQVNPNEASLTHWVAHYNECGGEPSITFKANKPWAKISWGVLAGGTGNSLQVKGKYDHLYYLPKAYQTVTPTVGILFSLSLPRLSERFSLQKEIHFNKTHYTHTYTVTRPSTTEYHQSHIQVNAVSFPVSVKYTLPLRRQSIYFQVGLQYDHYLESQTQLVIQRNTGQDTYTHTNENPFPLKTSRTGIWAGMGLQKAMGKFTAQTTVRYIHHPMYNERNISIDRLGLYLIFQKK